MRTIILSIIILLCLQVPSFAIGGRFRQNNTHHQPKYYYPTYYYVQPQVVHEKYVIPVREVRYAEVSGLKILEDANKNEYIVINGKLYPRNNLENALREEVNEIRKNNDIIIERTLKY